MEVVYLGRGKNKKKKHKSFCDRVFDVFLLLVMVTVVIIVLYPIWNMIVRSFECTHLAWYSGGRIQYYEKGHSDYLSALRFWPQEFTLRNYVFAFSNSEFIRVFANTLLRTALGTILGVGINVGLAFILSRKEFLFRKQLSVFWIIVSSLECGIIPMLAFLKTLHLTGTFWVYIVPGIVNVLYVFVIRTYMNSIPESLIDQAKAEGASYLQIFTRIVSPMCKPVYAAIAFLTAATHWNSWFDVMLYNRYNKEEYTLSYRIFQSTLDYHGSLYENYTYRATVTVIYMLPILVFGIMMQRYYIGGMENFIANSVKKD